MWIQNKIKEVDKKMSKMYESEWETVCEECGEEVEVFGYTISCSNGCFEDDTRNYLSFNYR